MAPGEGLRPRIWVALLALILVTTAVSAWLVHPICVPLTPADVESFNRWRPLEQRTDRQLHGRVFRQRAGQWYQCKSWISRQLFF
jgi:hypothetical protein